jgi:hypothetical protein
METYRCVVDNLGSLARRVKGSRSHQFTTETGMRIYFNTQGLPINVVDDLPVTNLENHILEKWVHEYFYNLVSTDPVTALSAIKNGADSIILEVIGAINPGERYRFRYWNWEPRSEEKFTIEELLHGSWYTAVDAY